MFRQNLMRDVRCLLNTLERKPAQNVLAKSDHFVLGLTVAGQMFDGDQFVRAAPC